MLTTWVKHYRNRLLWGGPAVVAIILILFYVFGGRYVSTDDAYVQAAKAAISSNVPGQVMVVYVHDNQKVKTGDRLFSLDDRPYKIAVENAEARLAGAKLQFLALKATYQRQVANVQAAKGTWLYQKDELERQKKLAASGISSQMQLSQALNNNNVAQQQYAAAQQQLANALAGLGNNINISADKHPLVQEAKAQLDKANLKLSYTLIKAPIDGVVTKVEQLQPGDYINAGAPVFALISDKNVWIEANFKETQMTYLRTGQQAKIKIDTDSNKKITGYIASTSPGTGSAFSLLPPENATGNWVKIVQRIPIRITISDPHDVSLLQAGSSASVTIDTGHSRAFRAD